MERLRAKKKRTKKNKRKKRKTAEIGKEGTRAVGKEIFGTKTWYRSGFLRAESGLQLGLKVEATKGFLLSFRLASFASFLFSGSTLSVTERQRLTIGLMRKTSIVLAYENSRFSSLFAAGDVSRGGT